MNGANIKQFYLNSIDEEKAKLIPLKKQIFIIATLRLLTLTLGIVICYLTWNNTLLTIAIALFFFFIFILLLNYYGKLILKKKYSLTLIEISEDELKGLNYDFSAFDGAPEKIQAEHSYSFDLDLFGDRSFFQSINRTVTSSGKDYLARCILFPQKDREVILGYQKAIQELAKKLKYITHFRIMGKITQKEIHNSSKLTETYSHKNLLYKNKFWAILTYIVPLSYIVLLILFLSGLISAIYFIPLWLVTFTISSFSIKPINSILDIFDKKTDILTTYSQLLQIIEDEKFHSTLLTANQDLTHSQIKASLAIKKLERYCSNLNMGLSYPVILFFNPVLFWNVNYAIKVEKWLEKYQNEIPKWMESIAHMDALCSLSMFAYNHPEYIYPTIITEHFSFTGKNLGHPLIPENTCVKNNVSIDKDSYFLVITGANMAGKSTYLRTIGINHVLACMGAPVCASSLEFYPGNLVTNLRTTDSLADNESYFFSELKRLKMIIDRLQSGERLFIILDEILKGTNSEDKQKGSLALMKQLISLQGNGIIATHDLVLGSLENEYPENVKNYCFEADITENRLTFTYKIREGIAQNMNATFLMKQMGITGL